VRGGVTTKGLRGCPRILGLALVRAKAASDDLCDRAAAAFGLLRELAVVVDGERDGPAAVLLGLATAMRGTLLKERRRRAAELLCISPAHLRTSDRETALVEAVADELYAADSAYRLRHRHRTAPERAAGESRLNVDWLDRHQAYRRVWTPVAALRDDLAVLLDYLPEGRDGAAICDRLVTMTWRYAQFVAELERFIQDYGGLWLLSDVDKEVAAAAAIQRLGLLVPFGSADDSWLRLVLGEARGGELEPFSDRLLAGERGEEVLAVWLAWAKSCGCGGSPPARSRCAVHAWIAAADELSRLLDEDWLAVADWYRLAERMVPPHEHTRQH
jgi:hypothetical protein